MGYEKLKLLSNIFLALSVFLILLTIYIYFSFDIKNIYKIISKKKINKEIESIKDGSKSPKSKINGKDLSYKSPDFITKTGSLRVNTWELNNNITEDTSLLIKDNDTNNNTTLLNNHNSLELIVEYELDFTESTHTIE